MSQVLTFQASYFIFLLQHQLANFIHRNFIFTFKEIPSTTTTKKINKMRREYRRSFFRKKNKYYAHINICAKLNAKEEEENCHFN